MTLSQSPTSPSVNGVSQEPTHTPGPWMWDDDVCDYDPEQQAPWLVDGDLSPVLTGQIKCASYADARLIAAAPDLLAALRIAIRQNSHDMLMTGEELRRCGAAIARASGEKT